MNGLAGTARFLPVRAPTDGKLRRGSKTQAPVVCGTALHLSDSQDHEKCGNTWGVALLTQWYRRTLIGTARSQPNRNSLRSGVAHTAIPLEIPYPLAPGGQGQGEIPEKGVTPGFPAYFLRISAWKGYLRKVPHAGTISIRPSASIRRSAAVTAVLDTLYSLANSATEGSRPSCGHSPAARRARIPSSTRLLGSRGLSSPGDTCS